MNEISTKVKKLNIFQRLRIRYIKFQLISKRISIEKFRQLPEYIQTNADIKKTATSIFSDEELRKAEYIRQYPDRFLELYAKSYTKDIVELLDEDISLYEELPYKIKKEIQQKLFIPRHARIFTKLLLKDIKCTKDFKLETLSRESIKEVFTVLLKNNRELNNKQIINLCLHSKILSAIGHLDSGNDTFGEIKLYDFDKNDVFFNYVKEQIEFFKYVDLNTIAELVKIDANYVLPYLAEEKISIQTHDERLSAEARARNLFVELYGEEKYNDFIECFSIVFDLEEEYSQTSERNPVEVPLEEFKILFNSTIIEKCNPELIKRYFNALKNHEETRTLFEDIIQETYGERALEILKSRPQLNVHSINSLEVFDSRILDEYGEGFVHDCISYNIRNFSEFLDAIKDEEKNELFKNYYSILTGIYGNNVETMQKAISEFNYVEDLLRQVKDMDMTNEQAMNLLNVLCAEKNPLNVETVDDLNNYNNLANEQLNIILKELEEYEQSNPFLQIIQEYDDDNIREIKEFKDELCRNILGIRYKQTRDDEYGFSLEEICALYDINEEKGSIGEYNSEEKRLLDIMNFIINENNPRNLFNFIKNLGDVTSLRNYTAIAKVIEKVQEKELSKMNENITTLEKLDEKCESQKNEEVPTVYKEEIEGVKIYHLNGEPFFMFQHSTRDGYSIEDLLYYEGQNGNTGISTRIAKSGTNAIKDKTFLYGEITSKGLIAINNGSDGSGFIDYRDARTTHAAKRAKMHGDTDIRVTQLQEAIMYYDNEVALYRRQRDHTRISNENNGGRITPMAYSVVIPEGTAKEVASKKIENAAQKLKGTGIAIIVYHPEAYRKKQQERGQATKTQQEDFSR